ncbi:MAG: hypothetical protein NTW49_04885 [Bacteroidia bacterium]|nr:hypothetical protein [Bacteroidia bacterium]
MKAKARLYIVFIFSMALSLQVFSQSEVVNFLQGGLNDGKTLFKAYLTPYGNILGADLNAGWFNSGAVHKFPGFDLTFTLSTAFVPGSDKTFDINKLSLSTLKPSNIDSTIAPTIAGKNDYGPLMNIFRNVNGTDVPLGSFKTPKGTGWGYFPLPMVKAAVGIPGGFELMGRYMPTFKNKDLSIGMWGVGLKYDILQYFPFVDKIPFLNVSVMGAYTTVKSSAKINFQWPEYQAIFDNAGVPVPDSSKVNYNNQNLEIDCKGLTGNLLVSINLPVITFYGAAGYSTSSTSIKLKGDYPLVDMNNSEQLYIKKYTDPVDLSINNYSGLQYTGGIRLKLGIITIHGDYTKAKYQVVSAGLGISFR